MKSLAHAHKEIRSGNSLKLPWDLQGNGQFTTESQGPLQMSDGDPRTGMFPEMRVTAGDTTCSMKGV